jgi:C-terminal processing protease CtpA/Prc
MLAASEDADFKFLDLPGVKVRAANAGKIAVTALVNDYSRSFGEVLPIAIRALGGTVIGTQTWGATGLLRNVGYSPDYLNDGSFSIADSTGKMAITVYEAGLQYRGPNYENYEGSGVTPDYLVPFDYAQFWPESGKGKDIQLEAALEITESKIKTGSWPQ